METDMNQLLLLRTFIGVSFTLKLHVDLEIQYFRVIYRPFFKIHTRQVAKLKLILINFYCQSISLVQVLRSYHL